MIKGFTDIHTHLFPCVDDGAADAETAIELFRSAWENGTGKLFLTPHYGRRFRKRTPEWYRETFELIRAIAQRLFPELELYLGSEVYFETDMAGLLSEGKILSMNRSRYVLLEMRTQMNAQSIVNGVYEVVRNGYTPILAHAERFEVFRKDPGLADEVLKNGAMIQLNADSVMGKNGFFVKRYCDSLLRENKVHFIASDAHDLKKRPPILKPCYDMIKKEYGCEMADNLFSENAQVLF